LTVLAVNLSKNNAFRRAFIEPAIMLFLFWGMALWFR
jgi:hypothetical protein